jgi:hypothetical protein
MEENIVNLTNAGELDMSYPVSSSAGGLNSRTSVTEVQRAPSVQLLQRGYIIGSANGGPIDVSEVVEGTSTDEAVMKSQLTQLFKNTGNLFYGKKVYVKEHDKFYYYSRGNSTGNMSDDSWKVIE